MSDIAQRLKLLRKELDLTQDEFARKLKITRNTIAVYETGRSNLSNSVIALICNVYSVSEDWLRYGSGEIFEINRENQIMNWAGSVLKETDESFKKRFVNMLTNLNEKDWEALEKMSLLLYNEKKS